MKRRDRANLCFDAAGEERAYEGAGCQASRWARVVETNRWVSQQLATGEDSGWWRGRAAMHTTGRATTVQRQRRMEHGVGAGGLATGGEAQRGEAQRGRAGQGRAGGVVKECRGRARSTWMGWWCG